VLSFSLRSPTKPPSVIVWSLCCQIGSRLRASSMRFSRRAGGNLQPCEALSISPVRPSRPLARIRPDLTEVPRIQIGQSAPLVSTNKAPMIWNDRRAPRITRSMAFTGRRGVIHPLQCPTWPPAWADSGLSPSGRAGCAWRVRPGCPMRVSEGCRSTAFGAKRSFANYRLRPSAMSGALGVGSRYASTRGKSW
jgi:hypothetical protein